MMVSGNVLWLIGLVCAVWVIYDVLAKQKKMKDVHKVLWVICAILFSILTAIIYYLVVHHQKGNRKKTVRRNKKKNKRRK